MLRITTDGKPKVRKVGLAKEEARTNKKRTADVSTPAHY